MSTEPFDDYPLSADLVIRIAAAELGVDPESLRPSVKLGALESALAAPLASFGGVDQYATSAQRAGVVASRICRNHPFLDGNKRTAWICAAILLDDVGLVADAPMQEIAVRVEELAAGMRSEEDFITWLDSVAVDSGST